MYEHPMPLQSFHLSQIDIYGSSRLGQPKMILIFLKKKNAYNIFILQLHVYMCAIDLKCTLTNNMFPQWVYTVAHNADLFHNWKSTFKIVSNKHLDILFGPRLLFTKVIARKCQNLKRLSISLHDFMETA